MKQKLLLMCLIIFSSCSKVLYTHQQKLDSYRNKETIKNDFGIPTEKRNDDSIEEWVYNFGIGANSQGGAVAYRGIVFNNTQFNTYQKFLKFTFDKNGNVLKWDSQGIDFTKRKVSAGKTIAGTVALIAITIPLAILAAKAGEASAY